MSSAEARIVKPTVRLFIWWLILTIALIATLLVDYQFGSGQPNERRLFAAAVIVLLGGVTLSLIIKAHFSDKQIQKLIVDANEVLAENERRIQVAEAKKLAEQANPTDLAQTLFKLGMTKPREQIEARASELGVPFVDLARVKPDNDAMNSVPLELMKKHRFLPIRVAGNHVWIATANVFDSEALNATSEATGLKVNPCMCEAEVLEKLLEVKFGS